MRKTNSWVYCHVTCNCQSERSVHARLDGCVKAVLHGPRYAPFSDWPWGYSYLHFLSWLVVGTSPILCRAEPRGIKTEAKPSLALSFGGGPLSRLESVLSCLFNESSVCLCCYWAVPSLLFKILAARPEPGNPACWAVISPPFQIFVMMRLESWDRNKQY